MRWVWCLHDRNGTPCPAGILYSVIKRNSDIQATDINTSQYSSFVNNTLYSYEIIEFCTGTPFLADAVEFAVDPLALETIELKAMLSSSLLDCNESNS